jgi:hypothetical protein
VALCITVIVHLRGTPSLAVDRLVSCALVELETIVLEREDAEPVVDVIGEVFFPKQKVSTLEKEQH